MRFARFAVAGLSLTLAAGSAGCLGVRGNGVIVLEQREVSDFTGITVRSVFVVEVETDEDFSLRVKGDENLLQLVSSRVEGDELILDVEKNIRPSDDMVLSVTLPDLRSLSSEGSGKIYASTFNSDQLSVSLSGSGLIEVAGEASDLDVQLSGSGKVQADRLVCSTASVQVSGSGKAYVDAQDSLDVSISGSGEVLYSIEPAELSQAISGSGKLRYVGG